MGRNEDAAPDDGAATERVYGAHAVRHALEATADRVRELWVQRDRKPAARLAGILQLAEKHGISVQHVARERLDFEADFGRHQGVLLFRVPGTGQAADLRDILAGIGPDTLVLALDGVQDPHNLGACVRSAAAAGASCVIIPRDRAAPLNETARKVACGAADRVPVIMVPNLNRAIMELQQAGAWVVGAEAEAERDLFEVDLTGPRVLVLGGEGHGLHAKLRERCDYLARIPLRGAVESLNVSVAAGICLFEAVRQRRSRGAGTAG